MWKLFFITGFKLLLTQAVFSQDIVQTMQLAGHYRDQGMYDVAVKYYRRVIFFGDDSMQAACFPAIAECQLLAGNYEESIFFYNLAANTTTDDSLRVEYIFGRVMAALFSGNQYNALQYLYAVPLDKSPRFTRKYHFYHGMISLHMSAHDEARKHFMLSATDTGEAAAIDSLFAAARLHRPDPAKARRLSIFLPGAGQAYAGNSRAALNSFLLNTGLVVLAILTAQQYSFWDGAASVVPWLTRYYMGGYRNAETSAIEKRKTKQNELLQKIIDNHRFR